MKFVRYGARGAEKPGILDAAGRIRDLSAHVDDIAGAVMAFDRASHIRPRDGEIWLTYAQSLVRAEK